jgi:hypothetical protein
MPPLRGEGDEARSGQQPDGAVDRASGTDHLGSATTTITVTFVVNPFRQFIAQENFRDYTRDADLRSVGCRR